MTTSYAALLRGINVGGKNPVPMPALRECFESIGASNVATYIQSGNLLFDATGRRTTSGWITAIEAALTERFGYAARIVLIDHDALKGVVRNAPTWFGEDPDAYRSDVMFLRGPTTAAEVVAQLRPRDGVDRVAAGDGVVYYDRLAARATQSRMSMVASLPVYAEMTIRNWRTTTRLLAMLDEREAT